MADVERHEHVMSMIGPYCIECEIDFDYINQKWADGATLPLPKYEPSIIRCPMCNGHGIIDNPNKGKRK